MIELGEVVAAQGIATLRLLGAADVDPRVNGNGGAIALGHPRGMSGAGITGTATLELAVTGRVAGAVDHVHRRHAETRIVVLGRIIPDSETLTKRRHLSAACYAGTMADPLRFRQRWWQEVGHPMCRRPSRLTALDPETNLALRCHMQSKIETYFAGLTRWRDEILALRALALGAGLVEEWKWQSPVYTHDGHNVAIIWGFSDRAAIGFFKGVLLDDPHAILTVPGANSRTSRVVNFTDTDSINAQAPTLLTYLAEAMDKAGLRIDLPKDDLDYPQELTDRIDTDPEFATAFETLTPGRRRGWVLHFSGAKQSATRQSRIDKAAPRQSRIDKAAPKILQGKGMQDR